MPDCIMGTNVTILFVCIMFVEYLELIVYSFLTVMLRFRPSNFTRFTAEPLKSR